MTITCSPALRPSVTIKSPPAIGPVLIGRGATCPRHPRSSPVARSGRPARRAAARGSRHQAGPGGTGHEQRCPAADRGADWGIRRARGRPRCWDRRPDRRTEGDPFPDRANRPPGRARPWRHRWPTPSFACRLHRLLQAKQVGIGLGEFDADRVELLDGDQMGRLPLADQRAFGHQGATDAAGNRRWRTAFSRSSRARASAASDCLSFACAKSYSCWLTA